MRTQTIWMSPVFLLAACAHHEAMATAPAEAAVVRPAEVAPAPQAATQPGTCSQDSDCASAQLCLRLADAGGR